MNPHCRLALVGNPNTGKTSVFNALTGLKQKVGNYAGVTVEKKTGVLQLADPQNGIEKTIELLDLPGLYSLTPKSIDDTITADVLVGLKPELKPDCILTVVDAANLTRNLYLLTQVLDFDTPVILILNMMDMAKEKGVEIDIKALSAEFGIPILPFTANRVDGADALKKELANHIFTDLEASQKRLNVAPEIEEILLPYSQFLTGKLHYADVLAEKSALRAVSNKLSFQYHLNLLSEESEKAALQQIHDAAQKKLSASGNHWSMLETKLRYAWIEKIVKSCVVETRKERKSRSEKADKILTHRLLGPMLFVFIFAGIFQSIFSWAEIPMDAIDAGTEWLKELAASLIPAGVIQDLIVEGAIAGVGSVVIFLPQILFLFFFLGLLEDTGYMARAAFMLDRLMVKLGLSGRSVIPLLSSFACAIPGIMATRTISNWKERLITIMIAPFMSCSARMPVYILLIGTFIPEKSFLGIISYGALTLLAMYLLGIVMAVLAAVVFKQFILKHTTVSTSFVMELPPYRKPSLRWTALQMLERGKVFITDAGKIILAMSVILWFLASYPKVEPVENGQPVSQVEQSYIGTVGKWIEPAIKPLGFDWKVGIGLLTSFAAREVMVSTMATIYNVEDGDEESLDLRTAMREDKDPVTGKPLYSPLMAVSLMVFFVLACQCMATVAIVKRETNSWRWPIVMVVYMTALAYIASLVVFQTGTWLGIGI